MFALKKNLKTKHAQSYNSQGEIQDGKRKGALLRMKQTSIEEIHRAVY